VLDDTAVKQLYENMRTIAITPTRSNEMMNSYGANVLGSRGLLAWAKTCTKLQITTPAQDPVPRATLCRDARTDVEYQLKNVLTQMALRFVEGVR